MRAHVGAAEYSCGTQVELPTALPPPTGPLKQADLNDQTTEVAATKVILTPDRKGLVETNVGQVYLIYVNHDLLLGALCVIKLFHIFLLFSVCPSLNLFVYM